MCFRRSSANGLITFSGGEPLPAPDGRPEGYEYLRICGRGAYGVVWLVRDLSDRLLVLKLIPLNNETRCELDGVRRYCAMNGEHPNLIPVLHIGETPDCFFYTMPAAGNLHGNLDDYLPDTLENRLKLHPFSPPEVCATALALLDAIGHLHRRGLVHRDIKPSNILFRDGAPCLADVGLIGPGDARAALRGTSGFLPPETLHADFGSLYGDGYRPEFDLYALGKVMYCMLTGLEPENFPMFRLDAPPSPSFSALNKLILRICDPNPAWRVRTVPALLSAIVAVSDRGRIRASRFRRARFAALGALGASIAVLIAFVAVIPLRPPPVAVPGSAALIRAENALEEAILQNASLTAIRALLPPLRGRFPENYEGRNALFLAARSNRGELVRLLAENGFPVDSQDKNGDTPLHKAVSHGWCEAAEALLAAGANPNLTNEHGAAPLHVTDGRNAGRVARALIRKGADPVRKTGDGVEPLQLAVRRNGRPDLVLALLQNGARADAVGPFGITPLHDAVSCGNIVLTKMLLDFHAFPDTPDARGMTPLHYAALYARLPLIEILLENGAAVDRPDQWGRTPLEYALFRSSPGMAELFLRHGANPDFIDRAGWRADREHGGLRNPDGVRPGGIELPAVALRHRRIKPWYPNRCCPLERLHTAVALEPASAVAAQLRTPGSGVNAPNFLWLTPLTTALARGRGVPMVREILYAGGNPAIPSATGYSPLRVAIEYERPPAETELLLRFGADPDRPDPDGRSPRRAAADRPDLLRLYALYCPEPDNRKISASR